MKKSSKLLLGACLAIGLVIAAVLLFAACSEGGGLRAGSNAVSGKQLSISEEQESITCSLGQENRTGFLLFLLRSLPYSLFNVSGR
jgi:hypothetical protein